MSSRPSAVGSSRGNGFEKAGGKAAGVSGGGVSHRSHVSGGVGSQHRSGAGSHRSGVAGAGSHQSHAPGAGKSPNLALALLAAIGAIGVAMKVTGNLGLSFGVGVLAGGAVFVITRKPSRRSDKPGTSSNHGGKKVGGKKDDGKFDHVHIYVLLDSSGSMGVVEDGVIEGYNNFVEETKAQLKEQRLIAYFTLVQFSTQNPFKMSIDKKKIKDLQPGFLTKTDAANNVVGTFAPSGGTPLYDALGQLIEHAADKKSSTEAVHIFVFSDGAENDSKKIDEAKLKALIAEKKQEDEIGWRFSFLGANQDAHAFADKFGLGADSAQNLTYDADGFKTGWSTVSRSIGQSISRGVYESRGDYGKRGKGAGDSLRGNLESIPASSRY